MKKAAWFSFMALIVALPIFIASCGSSSSSTPSATPTTTITGSLFAAPIAGASVMIKNAVGETIAGPVSTAFDGTYSVEVPTTDLASDLRIETIGGTYTDEATASTTTAGVFAAYVKGGTLTTGSSVNIDPSTTIIHELVANHTMTLDQAQTAFNNTFGYTPDPSVAPMNAAPATGTTNLPNRLAAFRAAVFSQLVKDLGLTPGKLSDLLVALTRDLADDGTLNGSAAGINGTSVPEDILNRFEAALATYMTNTTSNHTAVNSGDIGNLLFSKVALTPTYRVEFIPAMMPARVGKSQFKIKVTNRNNVPVTGLNLQLRPLMHMPTTIHRTPIDTITDNNDGTYSCTVYYLMASGQGMGFWEMKIMIGAESATFYPSVGMAMGTTTVRGSLKGQNDLILGDSTGNVTEKRSYYLFNDGLAGSMGMGYTFNLFIAVKESLMDMPAIGNGTVLHNETNAAWTISPMTVDASTDGSTWIPAIEGTVTGHWSVQGLSNLASDVTGTIYVRMSVGNGTSIEQKTTDGMAVSNANGYAKFIVTPGM